MHSLTELKIVNAVLDELRLIVYLNDGRIVIYPIAGMDWITDVPEELRSIFTVDEWEIYWESIDDGLTLEHILSPKPRVDFTVEPAPNWKKFQAVIDRMDNNETGVEEKISLPKLDKSAFSVASLFDESDDKYYWWTKSPQERLRHTEILRRINYGDRSTQRLQRFFEVIERETS